MDTTTARPFQIGDTVRLVTPQFPDVNGRVGTVTAVAHLVDAYRVEVPAAGSWADELLARDGVRSALYSADELEEEDPLSTTTTAQPFEVGDNVRAAGLFDEAMRSGPILMIHDCPATSGHEAFCAAYVEVDKSLPETDPNRLVQVFLTADAMGPLNERHRIERVDDSVTTAAADEPVGALTAPPGAELSPPPGMTPEARQRLADDFAALAATGSVVHGSSSQAGLASFVPSLVRLDAEEAVKAAEAEVIVAAVAWDDVRATGIGTAVEVAAQQLADAIAAYRAVPR